MADQDPFAVADEAVTRLLREYPPWETDKVTFLRAQFDAGLAYVYYPTGSGGLDLPIDVQTEVDERLSAAGAPLSGRVLNAIAAGQGSATIQAYGTDKQKERYLRPLFTCELMGCQLYSEPGSGSDLASLATRAERDGDDWIVNGQKVWTTWAHQSEYAVLLARTDASLPKR